MSAPLLNVPVVDKFSSPNEIEPLESGILPFASVKVPIAEPVAAVKVPIIWILVVPVGIFNTSSSLSFFIVTSFVEPWLVIIIPSDAVYPIAAESPADVSPSTLRVATVKSPTISTLEYEPSHLKHQFYIHKGMHLLEN